MLWGQFEIVVKCGRGKSRVVGRRGWGYHTGGECEVLRTDVVGGVEFWV